MAWKGKGNVTLQPDASPIPHGEDTSANHAPSHEEIRRRAYEIYLERGDSPGDELADWLRAERELKKVALFKQGWSRLEKQHHPDSEREIDIERMGTLESEFRNKRRRS
jgi:hypothetical protein